jgi:two-component system sensor histidine kinase YesM
MREFFPGVPKIQYKGKGGDLFHVRFGDIIRFDFNIDCSLLDITVPPLIIQPLVENATIHGFENKETGGVVRVSLEQSGDGACIVVEDNGVGMSEETRRRILNLDPFESEKSGHTTGIGIDNVVQRLRLFFGVDDVVSIRSEIGKGTSIILKIPGSAIALPEKGGDRTYV